MPLYHQIYLQLRDEIVSGQRPHGSLMPTELDLSAMFDVSRITARRVLDDLARQHYVARRRRIGTTVTFHSPASPIEANIDQALDSLLALGDNTSVTVLTVAREAAPPGVADALRLEPGDEVVRAVRVRSLDDMPLGYVLSYVPARLADVVDADALATTPMLRLLEQAGHKAETAEQTIGAMLADSAMAQALGIEPPAALLRITRTSYDLTGAPILLTFAHYRSDRFHVRLDLSHR
ncbi:GntR family transcriptional regulator [Sphingobium sp. CR2-8]|uniref:GntR family transcriptional regulator n=1 Tax=Sphingobium sp. CR2-8 TaxID=1306534 RepID=UPI002DB88EE9|nr:GntR family transcriptional regulator [Sphingobium sp. CR2-8]MEC3911448.1 GntR family transcriptional regulator [Sphingobium sp. CR2-8]